MLLETIRSLFSSRAEHQAAPGHAASDAGTAPDPTALAACVLLLEIAHADGEFSAAEREQLTGILERRFGLPPASVDALIAEAERERQRTVDHFSFTHQIKREYDVGRRMMLAEAMWGLVLSDGEVHEHEHYLTRKIANLLDLEPALLSQAKARAAERA